MNDQVLSINQMRHLQELGIDTSKASMLWIKPQEGVYFVHDPNLSDGEWLLSINVENDRVKTLCDIVPAFTLQDIIELLPESIMDDKNEMYKGTQYWYYLTITPSWVVSYDEGKSFLEPIKCCISESLLEAAYQMLCWCAENGYLEGGNP